MYILYRMFKTSKVDGVNAVSNEYTFKILGQDASMCPHFWTLMETI